MSWTHEILRTFATGYDPKMGRVSVAYKPSIQPEEAGNQDQDREKVGVEGGESRRYERSNNGGWVVHMIG